jgi:GntR family transcriptional regulator/MocR family aminotransferase
MRAANAERQALLLQALDAELGDLLTTEPAEAGMHLLAWLPAGSDDRAISRAAVRGGVEVLPLSHFCLEARLDPALILGFPCVPPEAIGPGVAALARVLRRECPTPA